MLSGRTLDLAGRAMQACRRHWGTLPQPKGPPIKALRFRRRRTRGQDSEDCCLTAFLVLTPASRSSAKVGPRTGAQSLERRASMSPRLLRPDHLSEGRHAGLVAATQRQRSIGNHGQAPSVTGLGPPTRSGHASLPGTAEAGLFWPAGGCRNGRRPPEQRPHRHRDSHRRARCQHCSLGGGCDGECAATQDAWMLGSASGLDGPFSQARPRTSRPRPDRQSWQSGASCMWRPGPEG